MDALLEKLVEENRPFTREGRVAGYIPELAKADRDELGICVVSSDGRISSAGSTGGPSPFKASSSPSCSSWR